MRNFSEEEYQIIYQAYVTEGRGMLYTSKLVNSSPETVKRFLKSKGIHIRSQGEAAVISNKNRATKKDTDYFKRQCPNMAWLLGFIASDGTIRKNENEIKIGLAIKDREILEKIKAELQLQTEVKEYTTNTGYDTCTLRWTCEEHKKDLADYHIVPAKTFVLKPPIEKLDRKYWIDYIRGYFDGDGSINLIANSNGRGNGNLRWQVCSATSELLEWIVNFFYEEYGIPKINVQVQNRPGSQHTLYSIQYSSRATRQIYNVLYTPNSLYLKRKKEHFEEILAKVKPLDSM